jgi:hypothetical protein
MRVLDILVFNRFALLLFHRDHQPAVLLLALPRGMCSVPVLHNIVHYNGKRRVDELQTPNEHQHSE